MKINHNINSKKFFFEIFVFIILIMSVLLFIGTTYGKYSLSEQEKIIVSQDDFTIPFEDIDNWDKG